MKESVLELPSDRDPLSRGVLFARYCRFMVALQAFSLLALIILLLFFAARSQQIPPIIGFTADHRSITGSPVRLAMNNDRFLTLVRDVVEGTLTRNDQGLAPALSAFLTPAAETRLRQQAERARPVRNHGFVQEFTVDEKDGIRVVMGNAIEARAMVRGLMTTKSPEGVVKNRFYWGVQFYAGHTNMDNPLGWRLNDLFEIGVKDFFADDLIRASAAAVKLPGEKKP